MRDTFSVDEFAALCTGVRKFVLSKKDIERVRNGRSDFEAACAAGSVYGANTGVGPFFDIEVPPQDMAKFQARLIRSHATGLGDAMSADEARGMLFLLINMLRKGYSGVSLETLKALVALFNEGIVPVIPSQGSLGASGDLVPLAHLALVLIGEGEVFVDGVATPTMDAPLFSKGALKPMRLMQGEGLALINGTHFMASTLGLTVHRAGHLIQRADETSALTFLALGENPEAFDRRIHGLRPHAGQLDSANRVRILLEGKSNLNSSSLQSGYSLRCIPQVHGAVRDTWRFVRDTVEKEINSVTGNPIIVDGSILHGGNFHGHPLALAADFLSIALTTLGVISERRISRLMDPALSAGLPPYLASNPEAGDCGMMMEHYAAAALASENKTLSHPASVDSIPTAGGQEDYVSMGAWAARKAKEVLANAEKILHIELKAANRALELRSG